MGRIMEFKSSMLSQDKRGVHQGRMRQNFRIGKNYLV